MAFILAWSERPTAPYRELAEALGVSIRTVARLAADPRVKGQIETRAREGLRAATAAAGATAARMVSHLVAIADDAKAPAAARIAAAGAVLVHARELIDLHELADAVKRFEATRSPGGYS